MGSRAPNYDHAFVLYTSYRIIFYHLIIILSSNWLHIVKEYPEISMQLRNSFSVTPIDRYSLKKLMLKNSSWL